MGLLDGGSKQQTTGIVSTGSGGPSRPLAEQFIGGAQQNQAGANAALAQLLQGGSLNDPALVQLRDALTQQMNDQFFGAGGPFQQANVQRQQAGAFSSSGGNELLDRLAQTYTQSLTNALAGPQFEYQNAAQNRILQALGLQNQAALGGSQLFQDKNINLQTKTSDPLGGLGALLGGVGLGLGGIFGAGGLLPGLGGLLGGGGSAGGYAGPTASALGGNRPTGNRYNDLKF